MIAMLMEMRYRDLFHSWKTWKSKHLLTKTVQKTIGWEEMAIVPILRAGIGMVDGLWAWFQPKLVTSVCKRDEETLQPVEYLVKLPEDIDQRQIFVVDPMLANRPPWL